MADIVLEPQQERLLATLVEAARSLPPDRRQPFFYSPVMARPNRVQHPGLPDGAIDAYRGDWEALASEGLLRVSPTSSRHVLRLEVTPRGFQHYSEIQTRSGEPLGTMEGHIRHYLGAEVFRQRYAAAWEKWSHAEELLWSADSARQLTNIGHLCREAAQEFAEALTKGHLPSNNQLDKTKTIARIRAVVQTAEERVGGTASEMLQALVVYWGKVMDLIQRQEHDSHREGGELTWEDARRVVFQTAVAMFEVDHAISKLRTP